MKAVRQFWEAQLPASTAAGALWRGLVQQANAMDKDIAKYNTQAAELCKALSQKLPAMAGMG